MIVFDEIAVAYDMTIDWKRRLEREIPFLLQYLNKRRSKKILDLACGSGQHLVDLAQRGYNCIGIDISSEMIQVARLIAENKGVHVDFLIGDMQSVEEIVQGPFDLIFCVGNSLSLLPGHNIIASVLRSAHRLLTEKGHIVIQVLNFEEIRNNEFKYFPMKGGRLKDGREVVFGRFFDHHSEKAVSTLVMSTFIRTDESWDATVATQQVLNLDAHILKSELMGAGFTDIDLFGNYDSKPLDRYNDRNIVAVAIK